ncbi:MAG: hypothetical protein ABEI96_05605 [Haloarculaceae archaeon]
MRPVVRYGLAAAALAVLGTAASTLFQMSLALAATGPTPGALVTVVFVVVPAVCGGWTFAFARRGAPVVGPRTRVALLLAGAASLATWAGFVVASLAMVLVALAPSRPLTTDAGNRAQDR